MKRTLYLCSLFALTLSLQASAQSMKINTLAGSGSAGFSGDGFNAAAAELHAPLGVAVDGTGNVYIEDYINLRVRKVNTDGKIVTIAGTGIGGYSGDNSVATSANMHPSGIAVDASGNLYIADAIYGVVRKVDALGIITTYAGTGTLGYSGDGSLATSARLGSIHGMAFDTHGNLFIADAGHHVVRKVDASGIITTFAGRTSVSGGDSLGYSVDSTLAVKAVLDSPYAVATDRSGNVFITDYRNNVIRKVDNATGKMYTVAGMPGVYGYSGDGGVGKSARLNYPAGIATDTLGNLYIADAGNNVIRKVDHTSLIITTVVGNGTAGFGGDLGYVEGCNLFNPYGIAVDKYGSIYIADANNERVRKTYSATMGVTATKPVEINVYPNPASEVINIDGLSKGDAITMLDMTGREVSSVVATGAAVQQINIRTLTAGLYMIQVAGTDGAKAVVRITKY